LHKYPVCHYDFNRLIDRRNERINIYNSKSRKKREIVETSSNHSFSQLELIDENSIRTNGSGTLILRKFGVIHTFDLVINQTNYIPIPSDYYIKSGILTAMFISENQNLTETLHFYIPAKTLCQRIHCTFCFDFLHNYQCISSNWLYAFYGFVAFMILFIIGVIIRSLKSVYKLTRTVFKFVWRILKFIIRFVLLLGTYVGFRVKHHVRHFNNKMYEALPMVIIALIFLLIKPISMCDQLLSLNTELTNCKTGEDNSQNCSIEQHIEVTLPNLRNKQCVTLTSKVSPNANLYIEITYENMHCHFLTNREYFTAPYKVDVTSESVCSNNYRCGGGDKCFRTIINTESKLLKQSFPGAASCLMIPWDNIIDCFATQYKCLFYTYIFVPQYDNLYEVRKINSITCIPQVSLKITDSNHKVRSIYFNGTYVTEDDITFTVLGTFSLPHTYWDKKFVHSLADPDEIHYLYTSPPNFPQVSNVGDIQLTYVKDSQFIFNPDSFTCIAPGNKLRCNIHKNPLFFLNDTSPSRLPFKLGIHTISYDYNGNVFSTMSHAAGLKLHIQFNNYITSFKTDRICVDLDKTSLKITGCHSCKQAALISFVAHSTCKPGPVLAYIEGSKIIQKYVYLTTHPQPNIYEFHTNIKCDTIEFCLYTLINKACVSQQYCLDDPTINLQQSNFNFSSSISDDSSNQSFFEKVFNQVSSLVKQIPASTFRFFTSVYNFLHIAWYFLLAIFAVFLFIFIVAFILQLLYKSKTY
jgi:hypothetical protein